MVQAKPSVSVIAVSVVETVLTVWPNEGPVLLDSVLQKLLLLIVTNQETDSLIQAAFLSLFARVLLGNPQFFHSFMQRASASALNTTGQPNLLSPFTGFWLDKFDTLILPQKRKLTAMALASLLATTDDALLQRMPDIVNVCVDVIYEVEGGRTSKDTLNYEHLIAREEGCAGELGDGGEEPETVRKLQLLQADPSNSADLRALLIAKASRSVMFVFDDPPPPPKTTARRSASVEWPGALCSHLGHSRCGALGPVVPSKRSLKFCLK